MTTQHDKGVPLSESPERMVVGLYEREIDGEQAVRALLASGFREEAISVARRPPGGTPNIAAEDTRAEEGVVPGAVVGGVLGGAAGLALAAGALMVPGIGPVLAAGPLAAALAGAAAGAGAGGLVGSMIGLGIPEEHAREYEAAVREGGYFVSVRAESEQVDEARRLLEREGARIVNEYDPRL